VQELVAGAPCELCVGAGGQQKLRWGRPLTVRNLPDWHSWRTGGHVVEVDRASGTVRVQLPDGPSQQVSRETGLVLVAVVVRTVAGGERGAVSDRQTAGSGDCLRAGEGACGNTAQTGYCWQLAPASTHVTGFKLPPCMLLLLLLQVRLGIVRPAAPGGLVSLLSPSTTILQQQAQQVQPEPADAAQPSPEALQAWLGTAAGLRCLSQALRPGSLLEYCRDGVWVPVVVVSCSLAYSRQPDALQAWLQEGFTAGGAAAAGAAAPPEPTDSCGELPAWRQLGLHAHVATVLLLDPGSEVRPASAVQGWGPAADVSWHLQAEQSLHKEAATCIFAAQHWCVKVCLILAAPACCPHPPSLLPLAAATRQTL
jgi:hypothetical protein